MKINERNIVFDSEASIRIERPYGSRDVLFVISQGPRGNASHITITAEEAQAVLNLLQKVLTVQEPQRS